MACDISTGRLVPCKDKAAGIKALYFVNYGDLQGNLTFDVTDTQKITELFESTSTVDVYRYDVKKATGLEQTMTTSDETGTSAVDQVLTVKLIVTDAKSNEQISIMAHGRPHIIVEYNNGDAAVVGLYNGITATTAVSSLGPNMVDDNSYTLTINGEEENFANFIDGAVKGDPFAGLANQPASIVAGV